MVVLSGLVILLRFFLQNNLSIEILRRLPSFPSELDWSLVMVNIGYLVLNIPDNAAAKYDTGSKFPPLLSIRSAMVLCDEDGCGGS